jgi:hypothetical protein
MLKATFEHQHGPSHTQLNFGAVPYRDGEMMQVQVDNSALMQLGWQAVNSLQFGLQKTIT